MQHSWMKVASRFSPYLRQQRGVIVRALLALLLATAMRLLEPWPLAFIVDNLLAKDHTSTGTLAGLTASLTVEELLLLCAGSVIVIAAVKAALSYFSTIGLAIAGSRIISAVRVELFRHLQSLSLRFHQQAKTGDLAMRLINDIGMLREAIITALVPMLANVLILVGMFSMMLYIDWDLALISLLPLPLLWWSTRLSSKKIHKVSREQRKREGALAASSAEFLGAMGVVQALSLESVASRSFASDDGKSLQQNVRSRRLLAGLERRVDLIIAFATAIVLFDGATDVLAGTMSPGDLLIFVSYLKNSFRPVREYAKYAGRLSKALAAAERVTNLLDLQPEIVDRPGAKPLTAVRGEICFERVSFAYARPGQERLNLLNQIDFSLSAGESLAIVGPSGTGKSTLLSLLLRLYEPLSGRILLDGQDISDCTIKSIRQSISYVPQDNLLFGLTVRENIALAATQEVTDEQVFAAARLARAHEFILGLPEGYDTVLSERGTSLSGGQRQRISIARAAIRQSPVLLLDEPGTGLDSEGEYYLMEALTQLMVERTTVIVTHNLSFAARAQRILVLENGRVVEQGTHNTLLANKGRYAELWAIQQPDYQQLCES
ncbi:ABC transporter ATP-binding protein [Pantoea sp. BAV 3049]|uniref:ABC transporter ATP-binding protein n=1 Tax=Pantoea sp. BAV 3049 TaxID=2654188 RepID=UPI00131D9526|nr:ABC transporter ATP-binding protein [Pantoea sp. BAV 3049]